MRESGFMEWIKKIKKSQELKHVDSTFRDRGMEVQISVLIVGKCNSFKETGKHMPTSTVMFIENLHNQHFCMLVKYWPAALEWVTEFQHRRIF